MINFLKNHINHDLLIVIAEFSIGFIYIGGFIITCLLGIKLADKLDEREKKINEI